MTVSQQLNHINENSYDDDITVTDIPKGHFAAVVANTLPEGSSTREMKVEIMPLEQIDRPTQTVNSGLYIKGMDETAVKVTVSQDGREMATNTTSYS